MGTYFIKGRGWRYHFKFRKRRYTGAWFKSKREALEAESIHRKKIQNPQPQQEEKTRLTFLDLINRRLEYVRAHNSKNYLGSYIYMARRWAKKWKDYPVFEITRNMIEEHIIERSEISNLAANKDLRYLKAVFGWALDQEIIEKNPCARIKMLPIERKNKYIPPKEDVWKVLLAATPEVQDYLWTIIHTMGRVGEINRLTWADVHFNERYVILYTRKKKGGHLTGRKVHMTNRLYQILTRRFAQRDKEKPWVFWQKYYDNKTGEFKEGPFIYRRRILGTLCKKVEVKDFRFHSLRHFGASVLKNAGVPETDIQENLGHEKLSTTHIYLQSISEGAREAIEILEREFDERPEGAHDEIKNN